MVVTIDILRLHPKSRGNIFQLPYFSVLVGFLEV